MRNNEKISLRTDLDESSKAIAHSHFRQIFESEKGTSRSAADQNR